MITFTLRNLSYRSTLEVIIDSDLSELVKLVKKRKILNVGTLSDDSDGYTITTTSQYGIVWVRNFSYTPEGIATLVHEMEHYRNNILRSSGIELSEETEEAYTYFGTEIIERILTKYEQEKTKLAKKVTKILTDSIT